MNYENYKEVKNKVQEIDRLVELLEDFKGGNTEVSINRVGGSAGYRIMTIDASETSMSPYQQPAADFVLFIIRDIEAKIARMKDELKEL